MKTNLFACAARVRSVAEISVVVAVVAGLMSVGGGAALIIGDVSGPAVLAQMALMSLAVGAGLCWLGGSVLSRHLVSRAYVAASAAR